MKLATRQDLAWVAAATLAAYVLGGLGQWRERMAALLERYEAWQVDELPLALTVMTVGLAVLLWRRHREAAALLRHNRELARQLMTVQERERQAVARELHDELAQHCTAIRFEAAVAQRCTSLPQAVAAAQRAAASAEQLQQGVRRLLRQLRPADLDALGLGAALQALCAQRPWPACRFQGNAELRLGDEADMAVYRVAQEALSNTLRHAHATAVTVRLTAADGGVCLQVQDDGLGFDPEASTPGLGLLGARERAAALGGHLQLHSAPGKGTCVNLWLPTGAHP
ncbi:ATP-binding protein [Roseateles sp. BYS87W]|uniref:Oxygen sensor histidine kinase NreB n=1 Tax=Pelomonas baiyunensis TaxID=3299026 RepID=A0ABW7H1F5_9BURK